VVTEETVPREFSLSQNYPNPFNPTTTINFSLPERSRVELKIYDLLGREVAALIEGDEIQAGVHRVQWNGRNRFGEAVSTGVYFYRIVAGGFVQTKKMLLIK
jgi:flagellar hook assembly protein FlgD